MNVDWNEFKKRINSLEKCSTPLERTEDGRVVLIQCPRCAMLHCPDEYECERCGWEFGFGVDGKIWMRRAL